MLGSRKGTGAILEVTLQLSAHRPPLECWSQAWDRGTGDSSSAGPNPLLLPALMAPRTRKGPRPPPCSAAMALPSTAGGGVPREDPKEFTSSPDICKAQQSPNLAFGSPGLAPANLLSGCLSKPIKTNH